jgi:hypothetical protein
MARDPYEKGYLAMEDTNSCFCLDFLLLTPILKEEK